MMLHCGWQALFNTLEVIRGPYKTLYKQVQNWHRSAHGKHLFRLDERLLQMNDILLACIFLYEDKLECI